MRLDGDGGVGRRTGRRQWPRALPLPNWRWAAAGGAAAVLLLTSCESASSISVGPAVKTGDGTPTNLSGPTAPLAANVNPDRRRPDLSLTPGATDPRTTQATIGSTICEVGYTKTVRDVPDTERQQAFARYGVDWSTRSSYEVDHLIALELGGSNDIDNLWPEPSDGENNSHDKDKVENRLHQQVCSGAMTLAGAQARIMHWDTAGSGDAGPSAATAATTLPGTTRPPPPVTPHPAAPVTTRPAPPVTTSASPQAPASAGASAVCRDGTPSFSQHRSGTCSGHGGVANWLAGAPTS